MLQKHYPFVIEFHKDMQKWQSWKSLGNKKESSWREKRFYETKLNKKS